MSIHTPLHTEIRLEHPGLDEVREFTSLIVRIRDENDVGINVEFQQALLYSKTDETYALDSLNEIFGSGGSDHWLYEVDRSRVLEDFKRRNPHHMGPHWNPRHYLVITDDEVIDVIALELPTISKRTDKIRGWIRPGEVRSG
jgi:hypothetical protein